MNAKAKELGMNDTNFKNCHGIDEDGHETSAYDIALNVQRITYKTSRYNKIHNNLDGFASVMENRNL